MHKRNKSELLSWSEPFCFNLIGINWLVVNDVFRDARRQLAGALNNNNFRWSLGGLREFKKCN